MDLWKLPLVQENIEESARIFFSNTDQTVSLIPALIAGVLAVLRKQHFTKCSRP